LTSGNPAATGTITFSQGSTVLGTVTLNHLAATLSSATLGVGSYSLTASYSGDASDPAVNSAALPLTVTQAGTVTALTASGIPGSITNPLTLVVQVASATSGTPTGAVSFLDGTKLLGTSALNANGQAVLTPSTTILNSDTNSITAVYSGDANFTASTSAPVTLTGLDFIFALNASLTQTVMPGQQAIYKIPMSPAYGTTFPSTITFTATGLPSGATYTFAPASILAGSGPTTLVLTVQTAAISARNILPGEPMLRHSAPMALGLLLVPLIGMKRIRSRMQRIPRILAILLFAALGLSAAAGLGGCAGSGTLAPTDLASHSIIKITATSSAGQGSINATLNIE
ncbi:MAG TPA: Ig-like domain-containing protein, partial [Acidobacteriaceae bacterium]|nr:Ig-like domain-containing protein [Acidobacteriaceae bacterium]